MPFCPLSLFCVGTRSTATPFFSSYQALCTAWRHWSRPPIALTQAAVMIFPVCVSIACTLPVPVCGSACADLEDAGHEDTSRTMMARATPPVVTEDRPSALVGVGGGGNLYFPVDLFRLTPAWPEAASDDGGGSSTALMHRLSI